MNLLDRDLFEVWRLILAILCTVYAAVVTARSLWSWIVCLSGAGRTTTIMRNYVIVQLLRLRPGRFRGELFRIGALLVALAVLLRFHI